MGTSWQLTLISAIIGFVFLIFVQYVKNKDADAKAQQAKLDALEKQASEKRAQERAANEALAKEVIASGDRERIIGFLRDSFGPAPSKVQSP